MKRIEHTAKIVLTILLIALAFSGIVLVKDYVGWATSIAGEGGNIYELLIDVRTPAYLWTGVYGVAVRVLGYTNLQYEDLDGGGMYDINLLFNCLEPNINHEVYASTKLPSLIDFSTLVAADPAEVDAYLNISQYDGVSQLMSAENTYTSNISVEIGGIEMIIPGTYSYGPNNQPSPAFATGLLKDGSGTFVFVSKIFENFTEGFNGRVYNYQMLIPMRNRTDAEMFYFFSDPTDVCPEGEGEMPNKGNIKGYVTTQTGIPLSNVIVDISGYATASDTVGFYNLSASEGGYRIYAVKSGYQTYSSNVTIVRNETTIHNIILVPVVVADLTGIGPGVDVGPGDDDGPGEDVGPGEAPLVPLIEEPKRIEGTDYIISLNAVNRKLRVGSFLQEEIKIFSFRDSTIQASFKLTGEVADLIDLDKTRLLVSPNNQGAVALTIFGRGRLGMYNGTIEIEGDFNASIPINIEVISQEQIPVQAMQMELDLSKKEVLPGEELRFKTDLRNMLTDQQYPVTLFYTVQDETGNRTLWTYSTNVYLRTSFSLLKNIKIPKDTPQGVYIIRVTATYLGLSSGTSSVFKINTPIWQRLFLGFFIWQWLIAIAILGGGIAAFIILRKKIEAKKRFHLKVDQGQLPKPGPRSGWWGKIAESDHKTYLDLEQLKIHTIVAGSTGGGKSISAQVIIEECLAKDIAVIVFDPTAQWTGLLRPCKEKGMLKYYPGFGMKPKDARAFNGNVKLVTNPREKINIRKYLKPGEIQIFAMNKLPPKDIDEFVANTIREVFNENFSENPALRLMLVYDEIHRILPKFGGSGNGFVQIERGCREFRKWGIGVMLVSQVLADFVGQIKANINTEVQMRTRDEGDLERIKTKYGDDVLKSLVKASVGSGMVQNAAYNRGKPYFVTFRPILHSVQRLSDEELEKYNKYNEEIENLNYQMEQLEELEVDVFDLKLELKLALDKVKSGNFNMVEVYLEGLRPRIKGEWEKLGKVPKRREVELVSEEELQDAIDSAKQSREDYEAAHKNDSTGEEKEEEDFFKKEVSPEKILSLANGMLVISLKGLYDEIAAMKQSDFEQHVNKEKNDFADWIRDAVEDKELASHIALKKDKNEILELIEIRKNKKKIPKFTPEENKMREAEPWFGDEGEIKIESKEEPAPEVKVENTELKDSETQTKSEEPKTEEEKKTDSWFEDSGSETPAVEKSKEDEAKIETEEPLPVKPEIANTKMELSQPPAENLEQTETLQVAETDANNVVETVQEPPEDVAHTPEQESESQSEAQANLETKIAVSPESYFKLADGTELTSVFDLVEYLRNSNDQQFQQYVSENKNDFASWIRGSFKNDSLADKIQSLHSKEEIIAVLEEG